MSFMTRNVLVVTKKLKNSVNIDLSSLTYIHNKPLCFKLPPLNIYVKALVASGLGLEEQTLKSITALSSSLLFPL